MPASSDMNCPTVEQRWADLGDVTLRYVVAGSGKPLVLVHGLGNSIASWQRNIEPLACHSQVYALDMPGHGYSTGYKGGYDLLYAATFMTQFMDALGLEKVSLAGSSLGGLVCLKTALDHPDRVSDLVLVGSAGLGRELTVFLRILTIPMLREIWIRPSPRKTRASLRYMLYDQSQVTDMLVSEVHKYRVIPQVRHTVLKILRYGVDLRGQKPKVQQLNRLHELQAPTLIIWGAQDRVIPASHAAAAYEGIKGSRLHIFDRCGHWPQLEKAEAFNQMVAEFLLSQAG